MMPRIMLAFLVALVVSVPAAAVDMPGWPRDGVIKFKATRNGEPLGYSLVRFEDRGATQLVQVSTVFEVGIGPISAFIYLLRTDTVWKDGRIVTLSSRVNDDGTTFSVEARGDASGLAYTGAKGQGVADADVLPTTYWRSDLTTRDRVFDTQYGGVRHVTMTNKGPDRIVVMRDRVPSVHWEMRGDLDIDLWYGETGEWLKLEFVKGDNLVVYERVAPGPGDDAAFVPLDSVFDAGGRTVRRILQQLDR